MLSTLAAWETQVLPKAQLQHGPHSGSRGPDSGPRNSAPKENATAYRGGLTRTKKGGAETGPPRESGKLHLLHRAKGGKKGLTDAYTLRQAFGFPGFGRIDDT